MGFSNEAEGEKLVTANTNFAFQLFKELSANNSGGNVFLSPASISMALAMTYLGATNETAKQMAEVLKFANIRPDQLHSLFFELQQSLTSSEGCTLEIANKLYLQQDYTILKEFRDATNKYYNTTVDQVDFGGDNKGACKEINEWVESKTNHKIVNLLQPGSIDPMTRLLLVSAVYFKGDWVTKFKREETEEKADFILANGGTEKVPLMHLKSMFHYGISRELNDVEAIKIPYAGKKMSFVVLLPKHPGGIADLEKNITVEQIVKYEKTFSMGYVDVMLYLPRFKLEDSFDLGNTLVKHGMKNLFNSRADLSGISGNRDFFVSKLLHKSFLEVNEEGSEAAAVTGCLMMCTRSARPRTITYTFRADHPFLFFIRDDETGTIVFMGKYASPSNEKSMGKYASPSNEKSMGKYASPSNEKSMGKYASPLNEKSIGKYACPSNEKEQPKKFVTKIFLS